MKLCIAYASGGMKMLATLEHPNEYIAHVFNKGSGDAADEILAAVNSHDDLVADNKRMRDRIEEMKQSGLAMLEHEAKRTRECLELRDQVRQLQADMEGVLAAGKVLAADIVQKQQVQGQLVDALKAGRLLIDPTAPTLVPQEHVLQQIDAALTAAAA